MELKFIGDLSHQKIPVDSVMQVLKKSVITARTGAHRNPEILGSLPLSEVSNLKAINGIREFFNITSGKEEGYQMMDVKMETGTGKTYVYTKTIYEMHKEFGYNKFIIAVPTLPIKAGTASFISDAVVKKHFRDDCGYKAEIELCQLEPQKQKKKGRLNFPTPVGRFFYGDCHEKNKIYVLLMNSQLLSSGKLLTREDYDQMVGDFHRPVDAIRDTRPVLIIDEPHRIKRDSDTFKKFITNLGPQLLIRYGATYPEIGTGKRKRKDYNNLVYDLNARKAFEDILIKGVAKEHVKMPGGKTANKMVEVTTITKTDVTFHYKLEGKADKVYTLTAGQSLQVMDDDFGRLYIDNIKKSEVELSNGVVVHKDDKFYPDQYSSSYQEAMIDTALQRHFETEREMFRHYPTRIKTLALFFIDSVESYRGENNDGWLQVTFKRLLRKWLELELAKNNTEEYAEYLQASLDDVDATCAGYFAKDNSDSDEAVAQEVKDILHGKKELLSCKSKDGKWNVRRFLFSKWTLKEGWDNPNVFTICKLRSSGSEISKMQEVGRGLRLPVDEEGNRIVNKEFMLNYIVDFTEKDFADKLIKEINGDSVDERPEKITDEDLTRVATIRETNADDLFDELRAKKYITRTMEVIAENSMAFFDEYPEFLAGKPRIKDRNKPSKDRIGIRKAQFEEIRNLWGILNRKYVLFFEKNIDDELCKALPKLIKNEGVFAHEVVETKRTFLQAGDKDVALTEGTATQITLTGRHLTYNEFLKRASKLTCIPIEKLHGVFVEAYNNGGTLDDEMFNENSLTRLVSTIESWKSEYLQGLVRYKKANYLSGKTALTNEDGTVCDDVAQGLIGKIREGDHVTLSKKYLYDSLVYDSDLERKNIMTSDIAEVVVYGKIPSTSICIPTVASSNYSPDFMYVVKRTDGTQELNVVIETKAYDKKTQISPDEKIKIHCAKQFFEDMKADGYTVHFHEQTNSTAVKQILEGLLS